MHCGFWLKDTKNNDEAIINQYKYLVAKASIDQSKKVLDAGCGVGGGAIYIAKHTGATVVGITISPEQIIEAKKNARKAKVDHLTKFTLEDYTKTGFADNSFDVVFAIESVCYAYPKYVFLREASYIEAWRIDCEQLCQLCYNEKITC
jgi:cyclopropane fatty-acyl-phospholipid synthase-like methyltransferase